MSETKCVNRLSRPSLTSSHTLSPVAGNEHIAKASLPYPSATADAFPLSPLLTLPPAFGAAYVGETFACTLCANVEPGAGGLSSMVSDIQIQAELQTPASQSGGKGVVLDVETGAGRIDQGQSVLETGTTVQRIVRHDLREEGAHVLAVTVTYGEAVAEGEAKTGEQRAVRSRTFRKLYQFAAQQAIGVRTKIGETTRAAGTQKGRRFAIEAQLENLSEHAVVLDYVSLNLGQNVQSRSLQRRSEGEEKAVLAPQDVQQVAFILDQTDGGELAESGGMLMLAQLVVRWRGTMGQPGQLTTGWLGRRQ